MSYAFAFDMDGTLADTRSRVIEAYERAGVEYPPYAWGLSWRDWLIDACGGDELLAQRTHRDKQKIYQHILDTDGVEILPPALILMSFLALRHKCHVVTGASALNAEAVLRHIKIPTQSLASFRCGMKPIVKGEYLRYEGQGVYIDDSVAHGQTVANVSGWTFVHYEHGESLESISSKIHHAYYTTGVTS